VSILLNPADIINLALEVRPMSEVLRELGVALSLANENFARNMRTINRRSRKLMTDEIEISKIKLNAQLNA